jgi:hypothetical protein
MMFFLLLIVVALAMNMINAAPAPSGCIIITMIEKKVSVQRVTWRSTTFYMAPCISKTLDSVPTRQTDRIL